MEPEEIHVPRIWPEDSRLKYVELLNAQRRSSPARSTSVSRVFRKPVPFDEAMRNEKAKLENEALQQDIKLKKYTLIALFGFLTVETALIFVMTFFQGFEFGNFSLEEWSFRLLISATITQITVMLLIAVRHLFPQKKGVG